MNPINPRLGSIQNRNSKNVDLLSLPELSEFNEPLLDDLADSDKVCTLPTLYLDRSNNTASFTGVTWIPNIEVFPLQSDLGEILKDLDALAETSDTCAESPDRHRSHRAKRGGPNGHRREDRTEKEIVVGRDSDAAELPGMSPELVGNSKTIRRCLDDKKPSSARLKSRIVREVVESEGAVDDASINISSLDSVSDLASEASTSRRRRPREMPRQKVSQSSPSVVISTSSTLSSPALSTASVSTTPSSTRSGAANRNSRLLFCVSSNSSEVESPSLAPSHSQSSSSSPSTISRKRKRNSMKRVSATLHRREQSQDLVFLYAIWKLL